MQERSFYFIINPISGKGKGKKIAERIQKSRLFQNKKYEIHFTTSAGDAPRLVEEGLQKKFSCIVAVGGDGTVNEVISVMQGKSDSVGIIPIGSGNGLAREMKIPLEVNAALRNLITGKIFSIDSGEVNGKSFACTAGVGFDAEMAHQFKNLSQRGIIGYIKTFSQYFFTYKPKSYKIKTEKEEITIDAFLITVANCGQWGNSFFIAPNANPTDGRFHISIIKKFNKIWFPVLIYRLLSKTINKSNFYQSLEGTNILITSTSDTTFHFDGETSECSGTINFILNPKSLNIIQGVKIVN